MKETGQHIIINPTFQQQQQQSTTLIIKHLTTRTRRENITFQDPPKLFIRSFVDCLRLFVSRRSLPVVLVLSYLSSKLTAVYYLTTRVIYLSQNWRKHFRLQVQQIFRISKEISPRFIAGLGQNNIPKVSRIYLVLCRHEQGTIKPEEAGCQEDEFVTRGNHPCKQLLCQARWATAFLHDE